MKRIEDYFEIDEVDARKYLLENPLESMIDREDREFKRLKTCAYLVNTHSLFVFVEFDQALIEGVQLDEGGLDRVIRHLMSQTQDHFSINNKKNVTDKKGDLKDENYLLKKGKFFRMINIDIGRAWTCLMGRYEV